MKSWDLNWAPMRRLSVKLSKMKLLTSGVDPLFLQISKAYKKMALKLHPDRNRNATNKEELGMKSIYENVASKPILKPNSDVCLLRRAIQKCYRSVRNVTLNQSKQQGNHAYPEKFLIIQSNRDMPYVRCLTITWRTRICWQQCWRTEVSTGHFLPREALRADIWAQNASVSS